MANLILSEAEKLFQIDKFTGIDRRASDGARACRNFRVLPDGSLEKREGYYPIMRLPGVPRAVWCGNVFGTEKIFCLIDNVVYEVDPEDNGGIVLGSVSGVDGKADFFYCRGGLYLVDGEDLYSVSHEGVVKDSGYVPIYGRDWPGSTLGKINEPINFLSDKIIVHFKLMDTYFYYLELGIKCSEILSCTLNGVPLEGQTELVDEGRRIKITGVVPSECEMCFLLRLDESMYRRNELMGVTRAAQGGGDSDSGVILFGGNNPSRVFARRDVDESSYLMSSSIVPESTEMYFPVSDALLLGDGREGVTAITPYGDKMLIFTETGAWQGDFSGKKVPKITRVSDGVGCSAPLGAIAGKYAYSVTPNGVFRWTSVGSGGCKVECISAPISELFSPGFHRSAVSCYSPLHGEVWFADSDSDDHTVFVYREDSGNWYTFDPIYTDRFFTLQGRTAMLYEKYLLGFLDRYREDVVFGGMGFSGPIKAEYVSGDFDFSMPGRKKKIRWVMSQSYLDGEGIGIAVCTDRIKKPSLVSVKRKESGKGITYSDSRINTGRFERMNFSITASERGKVRVDKLFFSVFK
ncbi:MAG: hypothetical protein J6B55_07535 [Clostridia bacterium]|nr:hypothetical protein [Clostridia bacterium]